MFTLFPSRLSIAPHIASIILVLFVSLLNLLLANQAELSIDEAHYGLYALKPDWSYFDHPPMVGWMQILPSMFGQEAWLMRLVPIGLFVLINYLSYQLAFTLFGYNQAWIGFWTLVVINLSVMFQMLSLAMLPEAPLLLFGLLSFITILRLRDSNSLANWLLLGTWIGLAGLSKYTAIVLVFSILLLTILEKRWRWFFSVGPLLAVLFAGIIISPVIYWNAQHEWISFHYQLDHGTRNPNWSVFSALISQAAQLIVYNPLLYLGGLFILALSFWHCKPYCKPYRLVALFSLPILALFFYGSGYKYTLPHWTALAFLLLSPAVAHWVLNNWHRTYLRFFLYTNLLWALVTTFTLKSLILFPWIFNFDPHPMQDVFGWKEAYQIAEKWQSQIEKQQGKRPSLFVSNWTEASRLAWAAYPENVYVTDTRFDQFDMWFGEPKDGTEGILIRPGYADPIKLRMPGHFQECNKLEHFTFSIRNQSIVSYNFYHCINYKAVHTIN